jgi:hypothetical protein
LSQKPQTWVNSFSDLLQTTSIQEDPFPGEYAYILPILVLCCIRDTVTWLHANCAVSFLFPFPSRMMCLAYCKPENRMKNVRLLGVPYLVECYHDVSVTTDEVVKNILQPSLQLGVVIVFFDFI